MTGQDKEFNVPAIIRATYSLGNEYAIEEDKIYIYSMPELYPIIFKNDFNHIEDLTDNKKYLHILQFYKNYRDDIADSKSELCKLKKEFDNSMKNNSYSAHK